MSPHARALVVVALAAALALPKEARAQEAFTLAEAFRLALRNNESFRISEETVKRVRLLYDRALAALLPTIRVEGNFQINDIGITLNVAGREIVLQPKNAFFGIGSVAMSLFDARALPALRQTKVQGKQAEETAQFTQSDLLYDVARAYLAVLAAQRLVEVNKHQLLVNEEHLRDARARLVAGEMIKLSVTRAEIEVVKSQREVTRSQNSHEAAWVLMRFLCGAEVGGTIARPTPPIFPALSAPDLVEEAQRSRRDLRAAQQEIESARKGLQVAHGSFYPSLGVVASSRATQVTGFAGRVLNSSTLLTLGWTLFDGGTRYADLKEKHSLLREAILKRAQLRRSIDREVRAAQLELKSAEASLFTSKRELELARENHSMVTVRFRAGLANTIEVVDATTALAQAEVAVTREELNVDTQRVNLLRAIGADPLASLANASGQARGLVVPLPSTLAVSRETLLPLRATRGHP